MTGWPVCDKHAGFWWPASERSPAPNKMTVRSSRTVRSRRYNSVQSVRRDMRISDTKLAYISTGTWKEHPYLVEMCHRLKFITDITSWIPPATVTIVDELIISLRIYLISSTTSRYSLPHGGILIALNGHHSLSMFLVFRILVVFITLLFFPLTALHFGRQIHRFFLALLFCLLMFCFIAAIDVQSPLKFIWDRNMFYFFLQIKHPGLLLKSS